MFLGLSAYLVETMLHIREVLYGLNENTRLSGLET